MPTLSIDGFFRVEIVTSSPAATSESPPAPPPAGERPAAPGLSLDDWTAWMKERGESAYRAKQVVEWIFKKRAAAFAEMSSLGADLRAALDAAFRLRPVSLVKAEGAADATRKFLFRLEKDGRLVETVLIPATPGLDGDRSDRLTLCVSSQVGCAYDCKFCASGLAGFARNLDAGEIVGQLLEAERVSGGRVDNVVFMGMGEPLANFANVTRAIGILNAHWGVGIGARHITVSTSGLAPQIEKLAAIEVPVRLAVSLHGATDPVRDRIMPVNRQYPLDRLFAALRVWSERRKQKITFEYILIDGVNDGLDEAEHLARRGRALGAKVNLIPYNTVEGLEWKRPPVRRQQAFFQVLQRHRVPCTLRREKGHDIAAACGQLRLREETAAGIIPPGRA
ncbi:MAG: 23S rRNA (adenine(2503)-C(2))-methyltransferase RlmN [Akkermansiaceae bacterium]|nr:23S rRNA (adenine(2503)-C(2))-methyltransferase RlmN [Akkermansiaceae bacterium]